MLSGSVRVSSVRIRGISEFIAILVILVVSIAVAVFVYDYVGKIMSSSKPGVKSLEASVVGIEVLHQGTPIRVSVSPSTYFTASYVYKFTVVIYNPGNQRISWLSYTVVSLDQSITIGSSDSNTVYDPVTYANQFLTLPSDVPPNQATTLTFTVLSKVDLLSRPTAPFAILISGQLPDGSTVTASVTFRG